MECKLIYSDGGMKVNKRRELRYSHSTLVFFTFLWLCYCSHWKDI